MKLISALSHLLYYILPLYQDHRGLDYYCFAEHFKTGRSECSFFALFLGTFDFQRGAICSLLYSYMNLRIQLFIIPHPKKKAVGILIQVHHILGSPFSVK